MELLRKGKLLLPLTRDKDISAIQRKTARRRGWQMGGNMPYPEFTILLFLRR